MSPTTRRRLAAPQFVARRLGAAVTPFATSVAAVTLVVALASPARADQPAPERDACNDKRAGDACDVPGGGAGACAEETCYELDYSQGSPPKSVPVACLVCKAGATPSDGSGTSGTGTPPDGLGSGSGGTTTDAGDDTVPETKSKCSVDTDGGEGPWWLLALVGLWFARRRR
jgi:MYXO-CTERM domain-containing protein